MCKCHTCELSRRVKRTTANGSHQQKNKLLWVLLDMYFYASDDLNYEKAIADGSWVNSIEIMEHRLKNAKDFRDQKLMLEKLEE
jgi:hypothetical protein